MFRIWEFYMNSLQGHPTRCNTPKEFTSQILNENIKNWFIDKESRVLEY